VKEKIDKAIMEVINKFNITVVDYKNNELYEECSNISFIMTEEAPTFYCHPKSIDKDVETIKEFFTDVFNDRKPKYVYYTIKEKLKRRDNGTKFGYAELIVKWNGELE
jgi:hypothetical protein